MCMNKLTSNYLFKLLLPVVLASLSLSLISLAVLSMAAYLDKPIPTAGTGELIIYLSGALFMAALLVCGTVAIYGSMRAAQYLFTERQAKAMANELIARVSARSSQISLKTGTQLKIAH
jgi:hypothetical protein